MKVIFKNCTHILTRTQGKKILDMLLVKIASKGTPLSKNTRFRGSGDLQEDFHSNSIEAY